MASDILQNATDILLTNATATSTIAANTTGSAMDAFMQQWLPLVGNRFIDLVIAPWQKPEMLWILMPLVVSLIVIQLYFGRYKNESMSWNDAVGNALLLVFVSLDLFRFLLRTESYGIDIVQGNFHIALLIPTIVMITAIWLLIVDFFHFIPDWLAFSISSALPINIIAYVSIVVIYVQIPLEGTTFAAAALLFIVLRILFWIIQLLEPGHTGRRFVKDQED